MPLHPRSRHRLHHREGGGAGRHGHGLLRLPPPPRRRAPGGAQPAGRHRPGPAQRGADGVGDRVGRPAGRRADGRRLRPGGHRRHRGHRAVPPRGRRRHRARRRGRQDHLPQAHPRAAHERHLRGRHRRVHRPDGHPPAHGRRGPGRPRRPATTLYPIASRCGVFAKTDVQPLLNQGAAHPDIAASVFQAVATQTIAGLACGRPIRGHLVFLGGPLHFLPQLRAAYERALSAQVESFTTPADAQLYVALGAALLASGREVFTTQLIDALAAAGTACHGQPADAPAVRRRRRARRVRGPPRARVRAAGRPDLGVRAGVPGHRRGLDHDQVRRADRGRPRSSSATTRATRATRSRPRSTSCGACARPCPRTPTSRAPA